MAVSASTQIFPLRATAGPGDGDKRQLREGTRTDLYGDPLPAGAVARMGTVRFRHHDVIFSLALSPDGKTVASAGGTGNYTVEHAIRLWDLATGHEIRQFRGHPVPPSCVVFSPDGKTLASAGGYGFVDGVHLTEANIRLWDVATGKQLRVLSGQPDPSPNNANGRHALAFSPDGKTLALSGEAGMIYLWDVATGQQLRRWSVPGLMHLAVALAFSPDGKTLAAGGGARVILYEVATGKELHTFPGHVSHWIPSVLFSPDGKAVIAGSEDETIRWWEVATGKELVRLRGSLLASTPDGKTLAIRDGTEIFVWDAARAKELRRFSVAVGYFTRRHFAHPFPGALSADAKTLIAADGNAIRLLDMQSGKDLHPEPGHSEGVVFVAFSPDGKELFTGGDPVLRAWDARTGKELRQFRGHQRRIASASLAAEGKTLASGSDDGTIRIWEPATGKESRRLTVDRGYEPLIALSPDGKTVAWMLNGGRQTSIALWELGTGKALRPLDVGFNWASTLTFLADGKTLGHLTATVYLWNATPPRQLSMLRELTRLGHMASTMAFSPDGRTVATNYYYFGPHREVIRMIGLWEVACDRLIIEFRGDRSPVQVVALSPDGRVLASADCEGTVRLWDIASGRALCQFQRRQGGILALAFSADGKRLASGGSDTTTLVWDVAALTARRNWPVVHLAPGDLNALWADLRSEDTPKAYRALWRLAAAPDQTVAFLQEHLKTSFWPRPTTDQIARLIADLDSGQFAVRQKAARDLEKLGPEVEQKLREVLAGRPSEEVRRRVEELLQRLHPPLDRLSGDELRELRAIQLLEQIGTAQAGKVLETVAHGRPTTRLTQEARVSAERLAKRGHALP